MTDNNSLAPPVVVAASMRTSQIFLIMLALLHGALILFLTLKSPPNLYNSPDEAANAFFASGITSDSHLARPAPRPELPSSVVPRGIRRSGDTLIPVGFVSVPVFLGLIAKIVGTQGLPILLAGVSVLSLFAWYSFVRTLFGRALALLAAALLTLHPMVIYWNARPFMPNALFIAFVIFTLFFASRLIRVPGVKRRVTSIFLGIFWGLTVAFRPQEGLWLLAIPLTFFLVRILRRRLAWTFFVPGALIPLGALLVFQRLLYGGVLRTGYHLTSPSASSLHLIQNIIFPFGFDLPRVGEVALYYLGVMIWWFAGLWILGIVLALKKGDRLRRRVRIAALISLGLASWLLFYYGSFEFYDRFDQVTISLGTSFTRYFLPFYVASTIPAAYALLFLRKRLGAFIMCAVIFFVTLASIQLAVFATDESLTAILATLRQNGELKTKLLQVTPADAIIFTERSDKIFYPDREVVTVFRSPKFDQPRFAELYPFNLYYETIADKDVIALENQKFWGPHGLKAVDMIDLGYRHSLYKLIRI